MFKRSFLLAIGVFLLVFGSAFSAQLWIKKDLPSSFDSGLTIEQAFKTSKVPLLVEFYSDTCGTCRRLTPEIHKLYEGPYKGKLTLVMLDVMEPENQQIAQLFGVDALPGIYLFDHKHMKKHPIPPEAFTSAQALKSAIDQALLKIKV